MKEFLHTNLLGLLKSKTILAVSGALVLMSCSTQMGGYSETDGVYYDPETDTLPEGVILNDTGNRVGEYYDYQDTSNIIENSEYNAAQQENRYNDWNDIQVADSDWGDYAGAETNIHNNYWGYGWGSPYWYGGFSPYWGSRFGFGWSMNWGWGNTWGWYGFNPYWGYGYNSMFWGSPYWNNWGYGGFYNGFYGYNPYFYGNYYTVPYRRSGANGRMYNSYQGNSLRKDNSAFRNNVRTSNSAFRNSSLNRENSTRSGIIRGTRTTTPRYQNVPRQSNPRYRQPNIRTNTPRNQNYSPSVRSGNNGSRSSDFNRGSSIRSSSSGVRSGGSSGSSRSGGGFRR